MDERDPHESLRELGAQLERAQRGRDRVERPQRGDESDDSRSAMGLGFRIGVELVVAVVVGAGIGWAIDHFVGTRPWGMIAFFFLGIAAGLVNVYRVIRGLGMAIGYRQSALPTKEGFEDED